MPDAELTHEEIIRVRHIASYAEEFHKIMKLAMNIAAYLYSSNQPTLRPS